MSFLLDVCCLEYANYYSIKVYNYLTVISLYLHRRVPVFLLNMQYRSWALDEGVRLFPLAHVVGYVVRLQPLITHSAIFRRSRGHGDVSLHNLIAWKFYPFNCDVASIAFSVCPEVTRLSRVKWIPFRSLLSSLL